MNILVINAGSSSLKYQLMNPDTGDVTAKGLCERIGLDGRLTHKVPASGKKYEKDIPMPTHKEAIEAVMSILVNPSMRSTLSAIVFCTAATSLLKAASSTRPASRPSATASPSARCTIPPTSWALKHAKRPCRASRRSPCSTPRSI